ncbi:MAG TPA: SRPBCC family protein [Streptosporangiaceae bacterium]|nr:SRPBCC family protein [Streptosporangiaceae bacterium]
MVRIDGQIVISLPVEEVFDFVADERNEPRYNARMRRAEKISQGPIGLGTRYRAEVMSMGRPIPMVIEFTGYERPRRLTSTTRMSSMDIGYTLTFEPVAEGTRMRWSGEVEPRGILKLMAPFVAWMGRRQELRIWTSLKGLLEGQGTSGSRGAKVSLILDTLSAVPIWVATPLVRPWHMRWGATGAEVTAAMPGDDIVPRAQFNATRAITIQAAPEDVWPWIAQLGYGRGGFYTYDLVDNAGQRSTDRIIDEYQHIKVGDLIPMFHESHGLAIAYKVDSLQVNEWMMWVHRPHENHPPDSTWSWQLTRLPAERTRLVTRMKQDYRWHTPRLAMFNLILMEFGDFAMERRMLKGIKVRAERAKRNASGNAARESSSASENEPGPGAAS